MNMRDEPCIVPVPDYVPPASIKDNNGSIYGWICPVCGKSISPYVSYCNCKFNEYSTPTCNSTSTSTSTTTTLR